VTAGIRIVPRHQIGERETAGFRTKADGSCSWATWVEPVYAPSPQGAALHELRVALGLTIGQAARTLGIGPADMSALEWGRAEPEGDNWDYVRRMLETRKS
jgi:hypothetical protein